MQDFLRDWSESSSNTNIAGMIDHASIDWFAELNRSLRDKLDDVAFANRIRESTARLQQLARQIVKVADTAPSSSTIALGKLFSEPVSTLPDIDLPGLLHGIEAPVQAMAN